MLSDYPSAPSRRKSLNLFSISFHIVSSASLQARWKLINSQPRTGHLIAKTPSMNKKYVKICQYL